MKQVILLSMLFLMACRDDSQETSALNTDSTQATDEIRTATPETHNAVVLDDSLKTYNNKAFKNVTVKRLGQNEFQISGRARVFEASFGWVVEDGHEELEAGHEMTDAGAPAFGKFNFTVVAAKKRPTSTLHLILFEASAKDGRRRHELPLPLY